MPAIVVSDRIRGVLSANIETVDQSELLFRRRQLYILPIKEAPIIGQFGLIEPRYRINWQLKPASSMGTNHFSASLIA